MSLPPDAWRHGGSPRPPPTRPAASPILREPFEKSLAGTGVVFALICAPWPTRIGDREGVRGVVGDQTRIGWPRRGVQCAATASCLASGRSTHWASSSQLFGVRSVDNYEGPAQRGGDRTGNGTDSSGHKIGGAESTGHYAVFQDRPRGDIGRSQPCSSGRVFFEHRMLPSLDGPFTPRNAPSRLCCDVLTDQDLASNSEDGSPESQPRVFLGTSHSHRARRPVRL